MLQKSSSICTETGGHYNPNNNKHGDVDTDVRHAGDMGNIKADAEGEANVKISVKEKLDDLIDR